METGYDAVVVVSFGGPESRVEVMPFLENVTRGRNIPRERLLEVAEHYYHFGGRSPINDQNRALVAALRSALDERGPRLPVYWGNRNWHPFLANTIRDMAASGVRRALAFATSAFGSYSGCRQYSEDIQMARNCAGEGAPEIVKLATFHNDPLFIEAVADRVARALETLAPPRRAAARLVFTAHSIPVSMTANSPYEGQLREACRLAAARLGRAEFDLVYQSRSGPPSQPWLAPDITEHLRTLAPGSDAVVMPIGFLSDHLEVLYDLDTEAAAAAAGAGVNMVRAATVGTHPALIEMARSMVERAAIAQCAPDCCPPPRRV